MTEQVNSEAAYRSPKLFRIGSVSDLTFGSGIIYEDSLGNPQTSYGKGPVTSTGSKFSRRIAAGLTACRRLWRRTAR